VKFRQAGVGWLRALKWDRKYAQYETTSNSRASLSAHSFPSCHRVPCPKKEGFKSFLGILFSRIAFSV
jgi:hypothetical protein